MFCGFYVFKPGFVTRRVAIVPVTVEQRSVGHSHNMAIGLIRDQRFCAVHPEGIFHFKMLKVTARAAYTIFFKQLHHQREHRWLRAAQIIGAVAVGDVPIVFDHPGEVIGHAFQQIFTPAFRQPQHGEIGIPVVGFAKTTPWNNVRLRQRQQRRPRDVILWLTG